MQIAKTVYTMLTVKIERDDQHLPHLEFWVAPRDHRISKVRLNVRETVATFLTLREAFTDADANMFLALLDEEVI
jgi:hypothetical protein